tara:strand:+ start:1818 stop:2876 length:1059 start_codon:yes stop_codon:yes gene_type:complete
MSKFVSSEELYKIFVENGFSHTEAALKVGKDPSNIGKRIRRYAREKKLPLNPWEGERDFEITLPPTDELPIEEVIQHHKRAFERKHKHAEGSKLIPCRVKIDGPIGVLHFGDPHLDNPGTDLGLFEEHCNLVMDTPALYCANVGDVTDNWVGRLAKLYAESKTTAADGWRLAEHYINYVSDKLLYLIGGNHDAWSGSADPLKWITRQVAALYQSSEVRINLRFPNKTTCRINARHDFAGHSQWNPAHGPGKALMLGFRDHIAICGHRHKSGHMQLKDPQEGINMQAIQVASYKTYDTYAKEKGFRDQTLSPCCVTVINTELDEAHPDRIHVFWDAHEGARYLTMLRQSYGFK